MNTTLFAALLALPTLLATAPGPAPVVLELFTSQGCSSCPPAEALLRRLRAEPPEGYEILPLAFHVDYWDGLGWKDPFSRPAWTRHQYAYARAWASARAYTPQAVVNGTAGGVGSDRGFLLKHLAPLRRLKLTRSGARLRIEGLDPALKLWVALSRDQAPARVPRGENKGRTLPAPAVVERFEAVAFRGTRAALAWKAGRGQRFTALQAAGEGLPLERAGALELP